VSDAGEPQGEVSAGTGAEPAADPGALMRSRQYRGLLVLSALIGVVVSVASWGFLELTHGLQQGVYVELRRAWGSTRSPGGGRCRCWPWPGC
jgi:hypothetical protein